MSDKPIVYAYVDLRDGKWTPCSGWDGMDGQRHVQTDWVFDEQDHQEYAPLGLMFVAVRGAEALRVAEREVIEAVNALYPYRTCRAKAAEKYRHGYDVEFEDGHRWIVMDDGVCTVTLARAVDIRDRLRVAMKERTDAEFCYGPQAEDVLRAKREGSRKGPLYRLTNSTDGELLEVSFNDGATWEKRERSPQDRRASDYYYSVAVARKNRKCRICGLAPEHGPGLPFVYNFGREHAHEACLKRISENIPRKEEPMSVVNLRSDDPKPAKPDPHAECRLHLVNGKIVDDFGRKLAGVDRFKGIWYDDATLRAKGIEMMVGIFYDPPDGARPPVSDGEPLYIECDKPCPSSERERICAEVSAKTNRPIVMLPYGLRRGVAPVEPEERQRFADIDRRADLGDAYRRGKHVGLVFGALALVAALGVLAGVAHYKPALACRAVLWLAGGAR